MIIIYQCHGEKPQYGCSHAGRPQYGHKAAKGPPSIDGGVVDAGAGFPSI